MFKKKIAILFGFLLLFGCQQQVMDEEVTKDDFLIEDTLDSKDSFDSNIKVGDIEWVGHVVASENESPKYQLLKIDKDGNEAIMYESFFDSLYPVISLKSEQSGGVDNLLLDHFKGYPEGGSSNVVSFEGGRETVSVKYDQFWGFVNNVTFKYPNTSEYKLEIETTNDCLNTYKYDVKELTEEMKTDILGLKFISEEDTKFFELENPINVPCSLIDGSVQKPKLRLGDIVVSNSWILIKLQGGVNASIRSDDGSTIRVDYR